MESSFFFCRYCGAKNSRTNEVCEQCGSPLYGINNPSSGPQNNLSSGPQNNLSSGPQNNPSFQVFPKVTPTFFNSPDMQFLIRWSENGRIYNIRGEEIAQISATNYGCYNILDNLSGFAIQIQQVSQSVYKISNNTNPLGEIEIQWINLAYNSTPHSNDYSMEKGNFVFNRTIFCQKLEKEIGDLHQTNNREYPPNFIRGHDYTLKLNTIQIEKYKIISLVITYLILYMPPHH